MVGNNRRVTVDLDLNNAAYNRRILESAAATKAFASSGNSASTSLKSLEDTAGGSTRQIDRLSGRLGLLVDVAATLGTSLIPIGAVGIPAVTGLASSLGFAAVGAGGVAAAMYGVSDSLKALNAYALKPTDENLKKVEDTLGKLAPDAQAFVLRLRSMGPELAAIRDAGAGELFPHWQDALDNLELLLPTVEELVSRVTGKIGELSEQGAAALAGPEWTDFFSFLEKETPLALSKLGHSVGNLAHATAELWMAFDPLNDDFLNVLLKGSEDIDKWATGLSKTKGFQEFVDYVETNGPQVADTVGAIASALIQILEAGAPIGAAVLPVLETLANIIGTIADSDLGTPLLALFALSRGMHLLDAGIRSGPGKSVKQLRSDLGLLASSQGRWDEALTGGLPAVQKYNDALERTRATVKRVAGTAGALGLLAASTSGLADKVGLSNTAMLAGAGLMAGGPWGAAIGGGIGLVMDFAKGQDDAAVSVDGLTASMNKQTGAIGAQGYADVASDLMQYQGTLDAVGLSLSDATKAAVEGGDAWDAAQAKIDAYIASLGPISGGNYDAAQSAADLSNAMSDSNDVVGEARDKFTAEQAAADAAAGAMDGHKKAAERALNPTEQVAGAIGDLGDKALSTSDKADALKASLDALLGPGLDLSAATDAWRAGLRDLDEQLSDNGRRLKGFTKDATDNREVIRGRVTDLVAMLQAEAESGASADELTKKLKNNRKSLLDAGEAAGLNRKALAEYLDTLGLTPKNVQTIIDLVHDQEAKKKAKDVQDAIDAIPKNPSTAIRVDNDQALAGARAVQAAIQALADKTITLRTVHMDVRLGQPRATGGPVKAGQSYIVGERRPELFIPETNGSILPSVPSRAASGGGSGSTSPASPFDAALQNLVDVVDGHSKKIDKALKDFEPKLSQGVDGVRSEIQDLRRAIHEAGGHWTKAMQEQADALIEAARQHDIAKALKKFGVDVSMGADGIRSEVRDLRSAIRDAGGEWTKGLQHQSKKLYETANAYDLAAQSLSDSQGILNDLLSQQSSYADQVGKSFNDSPFGNGLGFFDKTVGANTSKSSMFTDVLKQLSDLGLDGPLFQQLAASGDLKTAIQLLSTGAAGIDQREQAFGGMLGAQTTLGGFAGDQVFGQQVADQQAVVANNTQAMTDLADRLERQEAKFDRMVKSVEDLPRHVGHQSYQGTKEGAKEGITAVASDAGRRLARSGR